MARSKWPQRELSPVNFARKATKKANKSQIEQDQERAEDETRTSPRFGETGDGSELTASELLRVQT